MINLRYHLYYYTEGTCHQNVQLFSRSKKFHSLYIKRDFGVLICTMLTCYKLLDELTRGF